jgi:hypothetical protein
MSQRTSAENIRIEPSFAAWEQQHLIRVVAEPSVAGDLADTAFSFSSPTTDFYVYTGTDPAIAGATGIEVVIPSTSTAAANATLIATAVNTNANFNAIVDPKDPTAVLIQAVASGAPKTAAADVDMGVTITVLRAGALLQLGFIDGDIEVGLREDINDVTAHQTGTQIIQGLRTGRNIENISLTLKESDAAKLKQFIETSGVAFTPQGGTVVSAWGSEDVKAFGNISSDCRKLVLHPVRKPEAEIDEDMCFWRAYPIISGINISGESERMIMIEFKIIPDELLDKRARQFVYGDHTQNYLAV